MGHGLHSVSRFTGLLVFEVVEMSPDIAEVVWLSVPLTLENLGIFVPVVKLIDEFLDLKEVLLEFLLEGDELFWGLSFGDLLKNLFFENGVIEVTGIVEIELVVLFELFEVFYDILLISVELIPVALDFGGDLSWKFPGENLFPDNKVVYPIRLSLEQLT